MKPPVSERLAAWLSSAGPMAPLSSAVSPQARAERLRSALQWALGLAGAGLVAPLVFNLLQGLLGLAVAAAAGLLAVHAAPVLALKLSNWRLRALRAEVQAQPIAVLERQLIAHQVNLQQREARLIDLQAAANTYCENLCERARSHPALADACHRRVVMVTQLCTRRREALQHSRELLQQFADKVEDARQDWAFREAEGDFADACGNTGANAPIAVWQEGVAFTAVRQALARSFAVLDASLADAGPVGTLDAAAIKPRALP